MACRSARRSGRTDPAGPILVVVEGPRSRTGHRECSFLLGLAGGPLGALAAALLVRSRLAGGFAGRLEVAAGVGGALLGLNPLDGRVGSLPVGSLRRVAGLGAERPVRVGDVVGVPVLLDLGGGLAPGPPAPGRRWHGPEGLEDVTGAVLLDGESGGPPLPGQGPHHLPILRPEVGMASSHPWRRCWCWRSPRSRSWARLTSWVATANPPGMPPGWSPPRRSQPSMPGGGRPVAGWWPARAASACWRWALARTSSRVRSRGARSSWRRSRSRSARSSAVVSRWRSVLFGVSMARVWPPARDRAWANWR